MIFGCAAMIEYLTTAFPLEPGTIIATGTPAGVGAGSTRPVPPAATSRIAIEGIGELSTRWCRATAHRSVGRASSRS